MYYKPPIFHKPFHTKDPVLVTKINTCNWFVAKTSSCFAHIVEKGQTQILVFETCLTESCHHSPKHWILLHIYHIQGVIFSKITRLISLRGAVPDIFISKDCSDTIRWTDPHNLQKFLNCYF
jgi:hypothetical protein